LPVAFDLHAGIDIRPVKFAVCKFGNTVHVVLIGPHLTVSLFRLFDKLEASLRSRQAILQE
jgi:hypothetical protein